MAGTFQPASRANSRSHAGIVTAKATPMQHWASWTWDDSDPDPINWRSVGHCHGSSMDGAQVIGFRAANRPFHMTPHFPGTPHADDANFCGASRAGMRKTTSFFRRWFQGMCPACASAMDFFS